jgi:hypothetical protein
MNESVNKVDSDACNQRETKQNKPWQAPVVEVVRVRETETGASPGPDAFSLS